jgi:hypothetical protein
VNSHSIINKTPTHITLRDDHIMKNNRIFVYLDVLDRRLAGRPLFAKRWIVIFASPSMQHLPRS